MSRKIISRQPGILDAESAPPEDTYVSKIIKLIPAEIVSIYLAAFNLVKTSHYPEDEKAIVQWVVFGCGLLLTPFYLKKVAGISSYAHLTFCTLSFAVWVFSIGGPLDGVMIGSMTPQFIGAVFLPFYTLLLPLLFDKVTQS